MDLETIKAARDKALEHARAIDGTAGAEERRAASLEVERLMKALSDAISAGAKACPCCGDMPIGMEQPAGGGRTEYEVGCQRCEGWYMHSDKTLRWASVRGGLIPSQAVEAWNLGPVGWTKVTRAQYETWKDKLAPLKLLPVAETK